MTRLQALWYALTGRLPRPTYVDYEWCMLTPRCILDAGHYGRCRE